MMAPPATVRSRPAVRFRFRILAGLLYVIFVGIALGMAYFTWHRGVQVLEVKDVLMVPGLLWLGRLLFYAAARGIVPDSVTWPFATAGVSQGYWFIVTCLWLVTP